ncbi:MAG: hypothetical protein ABH820_02500 [Patescibacteria group bacterium]
MLSTDTSSDQQSATAKENDVEAPINGSSLEHVKLLVMQHLQDNFRNVKNNLVCKKCGSQIRTATLTISIYCKKAKEDGNVGKSKDETETLPLPFCPKCEGEPEETSTIVYE